MTNSAHNPPRVVQTPLRVRMPRSISLLAIAVMLSVVVACDRSGPPLVRVHGRVTFDGQPPPARVSLAFSPVEVASGYAQRSAIAKVADDGTFVVNTFGKDDGLAPGRYDVVISCYAGDVETAKDPASLNQVPPGYRPAPLVVEAGQSDVEVVYDVPKKKR